MMPTFEESRKKIIKEREKKKEEIIFLKEKIEILIQKNAKLKNSFFCPYCWGIINRE